MFAEIGIANLAAIGVVVATLVLAFFTYLSVRQARDAQRALVRPILIPTNIPNTEDLINAQQRQFDIKNVGSGVATDIWGVLFPYSDSLPWVPPQLSLRYNLPLQSGETVAMIFKTGGTMFTVRDRIGRESITVPSKLATESGVPNLNDRYERVIARLTLTCRDSLSLKHSYIYDLDSLDHWVSVNNRYSIRKDLRDLDVKKGSRSTRRRK
ncbi:MAG: hypothetical protein ABSC61_00315 [Anaerolineales bacterium]